MTNFAQQFAERYGPNSGKSDSERYIQFIQEVLDTDLYSVQREIITTSAENQKTAVCSANGTGKSYTVANYALAFLFCNPNATVLVTSASYSTMKDTIFNPMADLLRGAQERFPDLPGNSLKAPPRIEFDGKDDHFLKCISTSNAKDLEGRHNERVLVIVEECDSDKVDADVIDSAESSITDERDRMIAIGNPPKSKANSFYKLMNNRTWETLQYSSFDSRNVMVEMGEHDGPKIPGVVELSTIEKDWLNYNKADWPGAVEARESGDRDDLNELWYRRRLGMIPPSNANATRPFYQGQVDRATRQWSPKFDDVEWQSIGVDLATSDGSDSTIAVGVTQGRAEVLFEITSPTSDENTNVLRACSEACDGPVITDAIREENYLDSIDVSVTRFKGSTSAQDDDTYYNKRVQSYFEIGDWFEDGGTIDPDSELADQLYEVSEVCEAEVKHLRSREVYQITPKDELKKFISSSSPDFVDALAMACFGLRANGMGEVKDATFTQKQLFG